ncbi:hypothetical protein B9T31_04175 [Acinetobacter sp. ANC 4558]|uniref:hypothetical protein n=1 Tax=Acinetobacter sp. ANC 4558 TaxID=1977876 RepID=UPI000A339054|nr:hypothetical protein [Acinetobacter sp. ANC 4558]OTG87701.1 hypothetical protein B9T31_04175 [Acinetobacter sp. ANC 4558]
MHIGIPYADALQMPLYLAVALLSDERPENNTHQNTTKEPNISSSRPQHSSENVKKYVSTVRRNSGK